MNPKHFARQLIAGREKVTMAKVHDCRSIKISRRDKASHLLVCKVSALGSTQAWLVHVLKGFLGIMLTFKKEQLLHPNRKTAALCSLTLLI